MQPVRSVATVLMVMVLATAAWSQQATNPVTSAVREVLQERQKNLVAAAEAMPAEKYSFHPTTPQMTFGHLVMHVAKSNYFLCAKIGENAAPQVAVADTDPKPRLVAGLKSSFEFCSTALAKLDDSKLADELALWGGRKSTRAAALIDLTSDWADHYAMAAMYLRLNGLLPPTAKK